LIYLARQRGGAAVSAEHVAEALGAPANYLGKTLNVLARQGLLASTRGPGGGYRLARAANEVTLAEVVAPFSEGRAQAICLLGDRPCSNAAPCAAHHRWIRLSEEMSEPLARTTIADLSEAPEESCTPTAGRGCDLPPIQGVLQ
jgi:Rrf2 family iron-sulfur cluster assembly transcriptional regulator